jgi:hypothetical protein
MILAAIVILFGARSTVGKIKPNRIPIGGGSEVAYVPVGGTSVDTDTYHNGQVISYSIPVGGT